MTKPAYLACLVLVASAASLALDACGGQTSSTATPDTPDASLDTGGSDARVAPDAGADAAPDVPVIPIDGGANFAIHKMFFGDTDRNDVPSNTAWKQFGLNIDGKVTTSTSADVCTLVAGAPKSAQVDGANGIDNSWGANILPIILTTAGQDFSQKYNAAVSAGQFTTMIDVLGLTSDPAETSASTPAQVFFGATFAGTPTWTTADDWPVHREMLTDGQTLASGSKVRFPAGHIDTGTWTSGAATDVPLSFPINGVSLDLVVHHAVLLFDHTATTTATNGTLSGVLDTNEFIAALRKAAGQISTSLCQGSTFGSIAQQIRQASDILVDGTNVAGPTCDAISIGLGFVADEIGPPNTVAPAQPPSPDPCDAGTD